MKKHIILALAVCFIFTGCSCHKKPTDDGIQPPVYDTRNVSRNATISANSFITVENTGKVHIVWRDEVSGVSDIFYTYKAPDQNWAALVNISNSSGTSMASQIVRDPSGNLHAVWDEGLTPSGSYCAYANKPVSGNWSTPLDISGSPWGVLPQIGVDNFSIIV
ncbi:MAG: hypothetical protein QME74_05070 [Candidatus Edwardsbacteria bacterium]|nr:hypothetical protein [Candidatus Edwardsbacteria bacterium]